MTIPVACSNCATINNVELDQLLTAVCNSCQQQLVEEDILDPTSPSNLKETIANAPSPEEVKDVDVSKWVEKIGDQDAQGEYVRKGFWKKVKKYAAKVPFAREAVAMYYCAMDPATPVAAKATAIGALAYWILPVDLIPDFIPVVGFVDDATAILIAFKAIHDHIAEEHYGKADTFFEK